MKQWQVHDPFPAEQVDRSQKEKYKVQSLLLLAQRLINLEIPVLVGSLESSSIEFG